MAVGAVFRGSVCLTATFESRKGSTGEMNGSRFQDTHTGMCPESRTRTGTWITKLETTGRSVCDHFGLSFGLGLRLREGDSADERLQALGSAVERSNADLLKKRGLSLALGRAGIRIGLLHLERA
mmetsp:Transcript_68283/g.142277  ORF Transcript_68283/g.142277 Transcript_68283/m.142277 type:complete len:125 (+) Transcript_68283:155-529(+)